MNTELREKALMRTRVFAELVRRGILAPTHVADSRSYSKFASFVVESRDTRASTLETPVWHEPIPSVEGDNASFNGYGGFPVQTGTEEWWDHSTHVIEVCHGDGIEWRMTRAIIGQPYINKVSDSTYQAMAKQRMKLHVFDEPDMSWYLPGSSTLFLCQPIDPMPFAVFRRTFRYWRPFL